MTMTKFLKKMDNARALGLADLLEHLKKTNKKHWFQFWKLDSSYLIEYLEREEKKAFK